MAIRIVDGVPGSGKSFWAVHHLVKTHYRWDNELSQYKPKWDNFVLVSNIENLMLPHDKITFVQGQKDEKGKVQEPELLYTKFDTGETTQYKLSEFFNYYNSLAFYGLTKIGTAKRVVFFIDEAQLVFPRGLKDAEIFFFFQYHRHAGYEIYLLTQDDSLLANEIAKLSEYVISAAAKSLSIVGELRYSTSFAGQNIGGISVLRKDPQIFALYSSMLVEESEKTKRPIIKFLMYIAVGGIAVIWALFNFVQVLSGHGHSTILGQTASTSARPSVASSSTQYPVGSAIGQKQQQLTPAQEQQKVQQQQAINEQNYTTGGGLYAVQRLVGGKNMPVSNDSKSSTAFTGEGIKYSYDAQGNYYKPGDGWYKPDGTPLHAAQNAEGDKNVWNE